MIAGGLMFEINAFQNISDTVMPKNSQDCSIWAIYTAYLTTLTNKSKTDL